MAALYFFLSGFLGAESPLIITKRTNTSCSKHYAVLREPTLIARGFLTYTKPKHSLPPFYKKSFLLVILFVRLYSSSEYFNEKFSNQNQLISISFES